MYTFTIIDILNSIGYGVVVGLIFYLFSYFAVGLWYENLDDENKNKANQKKKHERMICLSIVIGVGTFLIAL